MTTPGAEVGRQGSLLERYLPIMTWLPTFQRAWLVKDGLAALSVWALLVPQSLGYASIAGVPIQYGLYTAFAALVAYAIFGTTRETSQGPSASVAAVSAAITIPLPGDAFGTQDAVPLTAALAITTGVVYLTSTPRTTRVSSSDPASWSSGSTAHCSSRTPRGSTMT